MRGKTITGEATVVAAQRAGHGGVTTTSKGVKRVFAFVLDVRPPDAPPTRVQIEEKVWEAACPRAGDVVPVSIRLKDRRVELLLDGPRYQPSNPDDARDLLMQSEIVLREAIALQTSGVAAEATVVSIAEHPVLPELQGRLGHYDVTVTIPRPGGPPFDGTFPLYVPPEMTPKVGDAIWVSYDAGNPAYVRFRPGGNPAANVIPSVRWRVPELCPSCGARIDQSFASTMAHPTCHMCRNPVPCEPLPTA